MSDPTWPVYTFTVKLETLQRYSWSLPNRTQTSGNETVSEADNMKNTRSTWLATLFPGVNIAQKDGYTFTVKGQKAQYLKDLYATGADAILMLVSS